MRTKSIFLFIVILVFSGALFFFIFHDIFKIHESKVVNDGEPVRNLSEQMKNMPSMQGDRNKRFTVDWDYKEPVIPGETILLRFRVYNAASGEPIDVFVKNYTKFLHLIVVNSSLTEYQHLHPEYKDGWFEVPVIFANEGRYNLYLDFVPLGAVEQQIGLSLKTAGFNGNKKASEAEDLGPKEVDGYKVEMKFGAPLEADKLSKMTQRVIFEITKEGRPVTNLKPYLGAFGHLIMINTTTYEYYHVHTSAFRELKDNEVGGPDVEFLPMAVYQPFKPGTYKIFAQFNPDGHLITVDFNARVE